MASRLAQVADGLLAALLALAFAAFIVGRTLISGVDVPGYASIVAPVVLQRGQHDRPGHPRRISGPGVHRGEAAPQLPDPRSARLWRGRRRRPALGRVRHGSGSGRVSGAVARGRRTGPSGVVLQYIRFTGVGMVATAVHVTLFAALIERLQISALLANLAAFGAALLLSFVGHCRWTFRLRDDYWPALRRFSVVAVLGLGLNSAIAYGIVDRLGWYRIQQPA
jgi:putative flippase GtrA